MFAWITGNIGTIIICVILLAIVAAIITKMIRDKNRGKSSCGCGCANCAMGGACAGSDKKNHA